MDELRFLRREDLALIVANDANEEFRLIVDDAVLSELRNLARRGGPDARIKPREIQALLRAGKSRAEVAAHTGLEESDVERYEEPVRAEREYIQELAFDVQVRADSSDDGPLSFGAVITQRLKALDAKDIRWQTWREEGADWTVSVSFDSKDSEHQATWSFDHRKSVLSPISSDAVNLSKQGSIGEPLIPKLRAVDNQSDHFDPDTFDAAEDDQGEELDDAALTPDPTEADTEYARRREIDSRAVTSDNSETADSGDFSQTADLLNALRERRGQREKEIEQATERHPSSYNAPEADESRASTKAPTLWSVPGVGGSKDTTEEGSGLSTDEASDIPDDTVNVDKRSTPRKGRASVPSWDDILFGTRSDDDPA